MLPLAYADQFHFKPSTLPPNWGDKGAEGQQKIADKMSARITINLIIITLLAILYMSHFAYMSKMRCPLNLVLENWENLHFY